MPTLLPPKPGTCPICAVAHEPDQPHNAQSLYYQYRFRSVRDRWPTWADAVAHCKPEIRDVWKKLLEERAAWTEPENNDPIADPPAESTSQLIGDPRSHTFGPELVYAGTPDHVQGDLLFVVSGLLPDLQQISSAAECRKTRRAAIVLDHQMGFVSSGTISGCPADCYPTCVSIKNYSGGPGCLHAEQNALRRARDRAANGYLIHAKFDENGELLPSTQRFCRTCVPEMRASAIKYLILFHDDGWSSYCTADIHLFTP